MTTPKRAQYVLVCEDAQHEAFARRFLREVGLLKDRYQMRVERSAAGRGAADHFVEQEYVTELDVGRRTHVATTLVLVTDGDAIGIDKRMRRLDEACRRRGVEPRSSADRVAVFVPTWNVETWLAYLDGETVDEGRKDYPRLPRPRDCIEHVRVLARMCRSGKLRTPAPESLRTACKEYEERLC